MQVSNLTSTMGNKIANQFKINDDNETTREIQTKINKGEYKLANLN